MSDEISYKQALKDLELFLDRVVADKNIKDEFKSIIIDAKQRRTVPIRGIHEKLMRYRKEKGEYVPFTDSEKKMLDDLMHLWG